jgi:prepilin-type N-terminal cleavage/methylation domain-containing protein
MSIKGSNNKGFTIIEVVLVLAIAGLIFLVVFLALPALQRGQRDTQRKNDLGRFMSQVVTFQSNNQGLLPASGAAFTTFVSDYLTVNGASFSDPSNGNTYTINYNAAAPTAAIPAMSAGNINVYIGSKCGGTYGVQANLGSRNMAAIIFQEQGNFYCQSN